MREILFRAKSWAGGEYIYGGLTKRENLYFIGDDDGLIPVEPQTIGQYTGMKDCNGRRIFENDCFMWKGVMRKIIYREDNMTFMCQTVYSKHLKYNHPFYLRDLNHYDTREKLKIECDIFDLEKIMDPDVVKIPRLVKENGVNSNGYSFEKTSLNRAINRYMENDGSLYLDNYKLEELNELLINGITPTINFKDIGDVVHVDEKYVYVKNLEMDIEDISKYKATFHITSDIKDIVKIGASDDSIHTICPVKKVTRILLTDKI